MEIKKEIIEDVKEYIHQNNFYVLKEENEILERLLNNEKISNHLLV